MQEQLVKETADSVPPQDEGPKLRIILKFFGLWFSSLAILVVIALLCNIEWARRHIESSLSQSFHRQVILGRLSWTFGLQGLAIDSDRFEMKEKDGNPFISSGPSEIGIAVLPLFERKLVVKHLEFKEPEVWASRLDDKKWNFSDLITEGPEIHMVQIEDGQLHLRNLKATEPSANNVENSWHEYDVKNLKLSLTLPKGERNWPLYFACKIPLKDKDGNKFDTSVDLSATGKGAYKDWQKNKYVVDLKINKFDPEQFRPILPKIPVMKGICDVNFKGEGIFEKGFLATISGAVQELSLPASTGKELEIDHVTSSANLIIAPKSLDWKGLKLSIGDWELDSTGKLLNWQDELPSYEAKVGGKLKDLKGFYKNVISRFLPDQSETSSQFTDKKLNKMSKAEESGQLQGSATIELHLKGDKTIQNISTNIKADGIPLAQLIDEEMGNNFMEAFKLDPKAPIKGEIKIDPGKRLELKNMEIPLEDSTVKVTGFIDQLEKKTEFDFQADNLGFDTLKKRIGDNNQYIKALCAPSAKGKAYSISGKMDVKGKFSSDGKDQDLFIDSNLKGLKIARQDAGVVCSGIKGEIIYAKDQVTIKGLGGVTSNSQDNHPGDFLINGTFYPKDSSRFDLDLRAHEVSIFQLKDWAGRFGLKQASILDKLGGDMHELKAHIAVNNKQNDSTFTINPADLIVNLSGKTGESAAQQFKLSSGVIAYLNGELTATDVVLSSHGGKLTLSGNMQGPLESLKFKTARLRTDGFELQDLQTILKGNVGASSGSKSASTLPDMLMPNSSYGLHGKVYGDMNFNVAGDGTDLNGVVGFNNVGARFGKTQVPVEKLTGVAMVSKGQVVMQDTTGQIGKSTFSLDGVISNYASSAYTWEGQLRGQFYPEEVDSIMANLGHGIELDARSAEALGLRVTGSGNKQKASLNFRGKASSSYGLSLKTAFGTFHQPKGRPLVFTGGLTLDEDLSELDLNNFQLTSSNELLQANGSFIWATETAEKPASIAFSLNTPSPVKTATILEIISQTNTESPTQIGGTSNLNLKIEGPVNDLVLSGSVALDKNSIPNMHMENLSGRLDLPGWHVNKPSSSDAATSLAKLQLKTLTLGGISLNDANAGLFLDSSNRIIFKDWRTEMAGGKLSVSGFFNPASQAFHADINISKLLVDEFVKDIIDHSGGVTGLADVSLSLDGTGIASSSPGSAASGLEYMRNMTGSGQFNVYQGSVASFGKLQEKLNESNLLQQGLFGFNVNNLLQAMMPVKSGQFNEVSGKFNMSKGIMHLDQLRFEGNNLRMRAAGKFDLPAQKISVEVAGDIPRVSSSIIPGAIGEMSRKVTIQRMFRIVTFKKLKDLPSLPLLGDLANDDPRAFTFAVQDTSIEPPKLLNQAAEKSFKWLPNKPFASAHPVPGI